MTTSPAKACAHEKGPRLASNRDSSTSAQLALAWGEDIVPIPGMRSTQHLEENLGALTLNLSADELATIEASILPQAVAGERYSDHELTTVGL